MLTLIPTPIGNLGDITLRALEGLKAAAVIVCEDTRRTKKLLDHYGIGKQLLSFHEHSGTGRCAEIVRLLEDGKPVALVTDGGMPVISDPGFEIVREALKKNIRVEALPGPSAGITALAASGLAPDRFSFFGFPPQKSAARKKWLAELAEREETLIFYESPHRTVKCLADMAEVFGGREAVLAREISKIHEEYLRGTLPGLKEAVGQKKILGECVILVAGKGRKRLFGH
ncbi:MAG: 16S rRNA (cytidine(1402)-2'-O)-methyltransferase [Omnitrophica bacterium GWA2_52_8]|nr:MAG: 16S rRNA (cytidine(1402)-2'-O)-methyltransferase [Omnitrophica bacterium GWA2_52_8]